jgi:hypothetical protein
MDVWLHWVAAGLVLLVLLILKRAFRNFRIKRLHEKIRRENGWH